MNIGASCGTLVWIGDPSIPEFSDAYQSCVAQVAQLALRPTVDEALRRPAATVRCILIAHATRQPINPASLDRLTELYPEASIVHLLGSLCSGTWTASETNRSSDWIAWHRWNQILPQWLRPCGALPEKLPTRCRSVAVVTSTLASAEPLLDLAESAGITAVWCRSADGLRVRNLDAVWWDDSVAGPTSAVGWRRRTAAFGSPDDRRQHAWIVNSPGYDQYCEAIKGGIDHVVSKPYRIECLLQMVASRDTERSGQSIVTLQAA